MSLLLANPLKNVEINAPISFLSFPMDPGNHSPTERNKNF